MKSSPLQFQEVTTNAKWDRQLKGNRVDCETHLKALAFPVTLDLAQKVVRLEHTVAELSKMATQSQGKEVSNNLLETLAFSCKFFAF